jgi:hypothetical protein
LPGAIRGSFEAGALIKSKERWLPFGIGIALSAIIKHDLHANTLRPSRGKTDIHFALTWLCGSDHARDAEAA